MNRRWLHGPRVRADGRIGREKKYTWRWKEGEEEMNRTEKRKDAAAAKELCR